MIQNALSDKVLVTTGSYIGTLAVIRSLGRLGLKLYLADTSKSPSSYSMYLTEYLTCPPLSEASKFIEWIIEFGKKHPGTFLYPCCDSTAWLYSYNKLKLEKYFKLYSPSSEVIYSILNKKYLDQACLKSSINTPKTMFPESEQDIHEISEAFKFPILLKPQTQVGSIGSQKGKIIWKVEDLTRGIRDFRSEIKYESHIESYDPNVGWPMVQEFLVEAMTDTLSIAGFIDETGQLSCFRSSYKVMQKPRKIGIGLCFESIESPHMLVNQCFDLCRYLGYYGAFEIEFINKDGTYYLIDFNPRYYSQMQFEIARHMDIPYLLYSCIYQPKDAFLEAVRESNKWDHKESYIYSVNWLFYLTIFLSLISLNMSYREFKRWLSWKKSKDTKYVDAYYDLEDRKPYFYSIIKTVALYLRHPRATFRHFFLER